MYYTDEISRKKQQDEEKCNKHNRASLQMQDTATSTNWLESHWMGKNGGQLFSSMGTPATLGKKNGISNSS
jgi:hypothetical protein